jgi:glutamate dehydrogenase
MWLSDELLKSNLIDHPIFENVYYSYFPKTILKQFQQVMADHPLRREIIATQITNKVVNQAGMNFLYQLVESSHTSVSETLAAYLLIDLSLDGDSYRKKILACDLCPEEEKYRVLIALENRLADVAHFFLGQAEKPHLDQLTHFQSFFADIQAATLEMEVSSHWNHLPSDKKEMLPLLNLIDLLEYTPDIYFISTTQSISIQSATDVVRMVHDKFEFDFLERMIHALEVHDQWAKDHKRILLSRLNRYKFRLMALIKPYMENDHQESLDVVLERLKIQYDGGFNGYFTTLKELQESSQITSLSLAVAIEKLIFLEQ